MQWSALEFSALALDRLELLILSEHGFTSGNQKILLCLRLKLGFGEKRGLIPIFLTESLHLCLVQARLRTEEILQKHFGAFQARALITHLG